jgi:hypothetical protein
MAIFMAMDKTMDLLRRTSGRDPNYSGRSQLFAPKSNAKSNDRPGIPPTMTSTRILTTGNKLFTAAVFPPVATVNNPLLSVERR